MQLHLYVLEYELVIATRVAPSSTTTGRALGLCARVSCTFKAEAIK